MLIPNVSAQFTNDGFYRVQNYGTKRYLYLTDNKGSYDMARDVGDFGALQLYSGHEKTVSDPSCILYIKRFGSQIDIQGQGVGIYNLVSRYVDLKDVTTGAFKGTYTVSATESGVTKYLDDETTIQDFEKGVVGTNRSSPYRNWLIHPVISSDDSNYFGITPTISVNGKYYYPLYAAFPFRAVSSGMKIYKVANCDEELGYAVLSEITGIVPALTPVLIECSSNSPSDNRLDLIESSASPLADNLMRGSLFCNYERRIKSADAVTAYNQSRMRILGVTSEGKLGFLNSTENLNEIEGGFFIPSNTSYLWVNYSCPSELTVVTEAEYAEIIANRTYTITYKIDGEVYKTEQLKVGQPINADTPSREGYVFNGWQELPETMPAKDITITGSYTPLNFNITYELDGMVYKVVSVPCGSTIVPLEVTKEGYTFSGWDGLPTIMPAQDITVSGSFSLGSYKLIYTIDGEVYEVQTLIYGTDITPLANPSRDGYTFSGWSSIPSTMPGHDVTITGSYTPLVYTLKYMVDGTLYQQEEVPCGTSIVALPAPEKDGYTFKAWEGLPSVMPAGDLTVTAVYDPQIFILTYMVDGVIYQTQEVPCGTVLTPIDYPVKEGYVFSGWGEVPSTMPPSDLTLKGTFSIGVYKLEYVLNGAKYNNYVFFSRTYKYGQSITPYTQTPAAIAGYTFMGWGEVPAKMPGHDVKVYGEYKVNIYKVSYYVDGKLVNQQEVAYGDPIPPYTYRYGTLVITDDYWQGTRYSTMPAKNVDYSCSKDFVDRIDVLSSDENDGKKVFDLSGRRVSAMKAKGMYIVNGKIVLKQ